MKTHIHKIISFFLLIICLVYVVYKINHPEIKLAFLGDSITDIRWQPDGGYVVPVVNSLRNAGIKVQPIYAGKSGNTTRDMLYRLNTVIKEKPDVILFMGGINDIWKNRIEFTESQKNIESIIKQVKDKKIKLIIISLTIITEDINSPKNKEVDHYNEFLKDIASKNNIQYIDINSVFKDILKNSNNSERILTIDDVHLSPYGKKVLADTIVKEFLKNNKHKLFFNLTP